MNKNRPTRNLKYFIAELMILIIGISVSFALNEYWQQRREQRQEVVLLQSFKDNLINDSTILSGGSDLMQTQIEAAQKLIGLSQDATFDDSVVINVVTLLSYIPFDAEDITYQEMKSLGSTHIIQNDKLSKQIIGLYERSYENIDEWTGIDADHVKDKLITYTIEKLPFSPNLNFGSLNNRKKQMFMESISQDEFRHLVQWGLVYKASTKGTFDRALVTIRSIIKDIDDELGLVE